MAFSLFLVHRPVFQQSEILLGFQQSNFLSHAIAFTLDRSVSVQIFTFHCM